MFPLYSPFQTNWMSIYQCFYVFTYLAPSWVYPRQEHYLLPTIGAFTVNAISPKTRLTAAFENTIISTKFVRYILRLGKRTCFSAANTRKALPPFFSCNAFLLLFSSCSAWHPLRLLYCPPQSGESLSCHYLSLRFTVFTSPSGWFSLSRATLFWDPSWVADSCCIYIWLQPQRVGWE